MGNAGHRQIDPLARQQLQRAQLVSGTGDGHGLVEGVAAEHFELTQRRRAVESDGGANAWDHGIKVRELAALIVDRRGRRTDVHIAGEWIEDLDGVSPLYRCFTQPFTRIERSIPGQYGNFHPAPLYNNGVAAASLSYTQRDAG